MAKDATEALLWRRARKEHSDWEKCGKQNIITNSKDTHSQAFWYLSSRLNCFTYSILPLSMSLHAWLSKLRAGLQEGVHLQPRGKWHLSQSLSGAESTVWADCIARKSRNTVCCWQRNLFMTCVRSWEKSADRKSYLHTGIPFHHTHPQDLAFY